jgi:hypothetical protein
VLVDGRRPGEWLVVPRGADVVELAARLERTPPALTVLPPQAPPIREAV